MNHIHLSEQEFINKIQQKTPQSKDLINGIGDDCAIFPACEENQYELWTTDMLTEEVHFKRAWSSLYQIGFKSVSVNLSDIAACGGSPETSFLSIALPRDFSAQESESLISGISAGLEEGKCNLSGGDTCGSSGPITINFAINGKVKQSDLKLRSEARPGDLVCVTGLPGVSYAVLKCYEHFNNPTEFISKAALEHFHKPIPPLNEGRTLAQNPYVRAMMDISDGLLSDLPRLAEASACGLSINIDQVPLSEDVVRVAKQLGYDPYTLVLHGGEDFGMLFTVKENILGTLRKALPTEVNQIGTVTEQNEGIAYLRKGEVINPTSKGFTHF